MKLRCLLAFLPLFLIACESIDVSKVSDSDLERVSEKLIKCDTPYIRVGSTCCLDTNNNSICDNDEIVKKEERFEVVNETPQKINEAKIIEDKTVQEENKTIIRTGCGNDVCEVYEDFDLCPQDCKRPLNTIFDVIDVIKKQNNSDNFIMIYTPQMAEYPLIIKLKEYLGVPLKDAKEITDFNTKNLILFNGACTNPITAQFKEFGTCDELLQWCEGGAGSGGYIKMIDNNGKKVISFTGCQDSDTEWIVNAMLDYKNTYFYLYTTDYKFGVMKR